MHEAYDPDDRREARKPHHTAPEHLQHLFTGREQNISDLEHYLRDRLLRALDGEEESQAALREALQFQAARPETLFVSLSEHDPERYHVFCSALQHSQGALTTHERALRLLTEPMEAGRDFRSIADEAEANLTSFPQDAIAFLQHLRPDLPEGVFVLPSTQGSIKPVNAFKDTRFSYDATTRKLLDYRESSMSECLERAAQVWTDLEDIAQEEGVLRTGIQTNRADPWKINVFKFSADPLRRFKALLYPKGRGRPRNVTIGELDDDTHWEEVKDEIYSYDSPRLDFSPETAGDVRYWVRQFLESHDRVHLSIQLEATGEEDIIVTFYVPRTGMEE